MKSAKITCLAMYAHLALTILLPVGLALVSIDKYSGFSSLFYVQLALWAILLFQFCHQFFHLVSISGGF